MSADTEHTWLRMQEAKRMLKAAHLTGGDVQSAEWAYERAIETWTKAVRREEMTKRGIHEHQPY